MYDAIPGLPGKTPYTRNTEKCMLLLLLQLRRDGVIRRHCCFTWHWVPCCTCMHARIQSTRLKISNISPTPRCTLLGLYYAHPTTEYTVETPVSRCIYGRFTFCFCSQHFYLGITRFGSSLSFGWSVFQQTILTSDLESPRCSAKGNLLLFISKIDIRTVGEKQNLEGRFVCFRQGFASVRFQIGWRQTNRLVHTFSFFL